MSYSAFLDNVGKKRAVVLIDEMYHEIEGWYPILRLREAGLDVKIIGPESGTRYMSRCGYPAVTDRAVRDVSIEDFDCLVIPGGYAADHLRRHPEVVKLVGDAVREGKVVAAICHAGWLLSSADVLRGRMVTSFFSIKDDLIHAGASWFDQDVVRDAGLVTSRGPDDLPAFMRETLAALAEAASPSHAM